MKLRSGQETWFYHGHHNDMWDLPTPMSSTLLPAGEAAAGGQEHRQRAGGWASLCGPGDSAHAQQPLRPTSPRPFTGRAFGGAWADAVPYLDIQVFARGGRRVGIGADGGAGVDVISAEVVYGVADSATDGAAVIPAARQTHAS